MRRLVLLALLLASCGDDSGLPDARVIDGKPSGGTMSLTWSLADGGTAVTCDQIGAVTVTVLMFPKNVGFAITEAYTCVLGKGTSDPIAAGTYDVEISLGGGSGAVVTLPRIADVVVKNGQDTKLGAIVFEVDATGGLRFRLRADANGNCTGTGAGGAGIQGVNLALRSLDETCVPTTFQIAAGAFRPASTYVSTCAAPPPAPCIDADQDISIAGAPSGRYDLVAQGLIGGTACWEGSAIVRVPAGGAVGQLGNILLIRTMATGCPAPP